MQSMVPAQNFMPAGKAATCFGAAPHELEVSLASLKGVRADWEWDANLGSNRFRFPLRLTWVASGSDANRKGVKIGDTVFAVRKCDVPAFVEVKATEVCFPNSATPRKCVSEEVNTMLLRDSACDLRIRRQQGRACSHCNEHSLEESRDSWDWCLVCTNCGVVAQHSLISDEAEWRTFADDDNSTQKNRVGAFAAAAEPVSSTFVAGRFVAGRSSVTNNLIQANMQSSQGNPAQSRPEAELLKLVEELCTRMDLNGGIPQAAKSLADAFLAARKREHKKSLRMKEAFTLAIVYHACKQVGCTRTTKEMLAFDVSCDPKQFTRACGQLRRAVPLEHLNSTVTCAAPQQVLTRWCSNLGLVGREAARVERKAAEALASAPLSFTSRHTPPTLAAAAIARALSLSGELESKLESSKDSARLQKVAAATGAAASTILKAIRAWPVSPSASAPTSTARVQPAGPPSPSWHWQQPEAMPVRDPSH